MFARYPTPVQTYEIPHGDRGILRTVANMRDLVHQSLTEPLPVETAALIVAPYCCGGERAQAIRDFLLSHIVFTPDPQGYELVRTPTYLLETIQDNGYAFGDCDDVATLGASLGMAVGFPARFVLLGFSPRGPFSHVFTELVTPNGPTELDTTAPAQFPTGLMIHKQKTVEV